jgi:hypothetical protein
MHVYKRFLIILIRMLPDSNKSLYVLTTVLQVYFLKLHSNYSLMTNFINRVEFKMYTETPQINIHIEPVLNPGILQGEGECPLPEISFALPNKYNFQQNVPIY